MKSWSHGGKNTLLGEISLQLKKIDTSNQVLTFPVSCCIYIEFRLSLNCRGDHAQSFRFFHFFKPSKSVKLTAKVNVHKDINVGSETYYLKDRK